MELPSHPEADDSTPGQEPATTTGSWAVVLGVAIIAAFLAVIVILHLTGVIGPPAH